MLPEAKEAGVPVGLAAIAAIVFFRLVKPAVRLAGLARRFEDMILPMYRAGFFVFVFRHAKAATRVHQFLGAHFLYIHRDHFQDILSDLYLCSVFAGVFHVCIP